MHYKHYLLLTLFYFQFGFVHSQIIYVNHLASGLNDGSSWENAFTHLPNAIEQATFGSEIWVAQGVYLPTDDLDAFVSFELKNGVALYGGFVGTETERTMRDWELYPSILSGDLMQNDGADFANMDDNAHSVIFSDKVDNNTILDGFIISGGNAHDTNASSQTRGLSGGAWYNEATFGVSNPIARNCIFTSNQAMYYGGVLYNDGGFSGVVNITFENCQFINNRSMDSGGAIYNQGSFGGECNPTFTDCVFSNNESIVGSGGLFFNNGISGDASPFFTNCIFNNNISGFYGGVAFNIGKSMGNSSPVFINCLFYNNKSESGGVLYSLGSEVGKSNPQLINCTLYNNFGRFSAGALNNNGGGVDGVSQASLSNCILWNNRTNGIGPDFKHNYGSTLLTNCLISATDCVDLEVGTEANVVCTNLIFNQYPMFSDTTNGDFSIMEASMARNSGVNDSLPGFILEDLAKNDRISETTIDLGAYELCGTDCILAIDVIDFFARKLQQQIELSWTAKLIDESGYFEIEHSTDGLSFEMIKQVAAKKEQASWYQINDEKPWNGLNYYRLLWNNRNTKKQLGEVLVVHFSTIGGIVYPNPIQNIACIETSDLIKNATIQLLNTDGKKILERNFRENRLKLDLAKLEKGVYFVRLVEGGVSVFYRKIIKI